MDGELLKPIEGHAISTHEIQLVESKKLTYASFSHFLDGLLDRHAPKLPWPMQTGVGVAEPENMIVVVHSNGLALSGTRAWWSEHAKSTTRLDLLSEALALIGLLFALQLR